MSKPRGKDAQSTEAETPTILSQGDDSSIPVPAVFVLVPGMPIVNLNSHQSVKLVNGASYDISNVSLTSISRLSG